ncbi:hypothetical protein Bca4012_003271 [Brassica carinata]
MNLKMIERPLSFSEQAAPPQFPISDAYSSPQILLAMSVLSPSLYCLTSTLITDAIHGLDDIRSLQPRGSAIDTNPLPVFLSQFTMESISTRFPYLVEKKVKEVMHGEDYVALGFLFGNKSKVAYISDISRIPPSTEYEAISKAGAGQLDLLILDTNVPSMVMRGRQPTHLCLPETLETIKRLCPKRALLTGMTHYFDHHEYNEILAEWSLREGIQVQLAHDGLRLPINL